MELQTFVFLVLFLFFVSFFYFASFLYKSCKLQFFGGEGRLMATLKINRLCNYFVFLSR